MDMILKNDRTAVISAVYSLKDLQGPFPSPPLRWKLARYLLQIRCLLGMLRVVDVDRVVASESQNDKSYGEFFSRCYVCRCYESKVSEWGISGDEWSLMELRQLHGEDIAEGKERKVSTRVVE